MGGPIHLPARLARQVLDGSLSLEAAQDAVAERAVAPPATERRPARARQMEDRGADQLNRTERRYRDEVLAPAMASGKLRQYYMPCPVKVRIGPSWRCGFEPDALVIYGDGVLELVDVKAGMRTRRTDGSAGHRPLSQDDAAAKIQAAARLYPWARWVVAYPVPRAQGGGWARKVIA